MATSIASGNKSGLSAVPLLWHSLSAQTPSHIRVHDEFWEAAGALTQPSFTGWPGFMGRAFFNSSFS
jgi:hypothetical protein